MLRIGRSSLMVSLPPWPLLVLELFLLLCAAGMLIAIVSIIRLFRGKK